MLKQLKQVTPGLALGCAIALVVSGCQTTREPDMALLNHKAMQLNSPLTGQNQNGAPAGLITDLSSNSMSLSGGCSVCAK